MFCLSAPGADVLSTQYYPPRLPAKFEDVSMMLWCAMVGRVCDDQKRTADSLSMDCADIAETFTS